MSWRIHLVVNTLVTTTGALAEIVRVAGGEFGWDAIADVGSYKTCADATLEFDEEHMEHMDYLARSDVQEALKRFSSKGDVCFASHDGDNKGKMWGYRFDGKGGMVALTGVILYRPVTLRKCPAPKKGVTTKVTRKVTKRTPKTKKPAVKGRVRLTCVACREQGDKCHDILDMQRKGIKPQCLTCGSTRNVKKVRV